MFQPNTKKPAPIHVKPLSMLTHILAPDILLNDMKRQKIIQSIRESAELEHAAFLQLALGLIHNITDYYQRLPESTLYFNHAGGCLDHALQRTEAAVSLFRQHLLIRPEQSMSDEQKRWWYALFSASMLRGVNALYLDYKIDRYSIKGQFMKTWEPLLESIGQPHQYYDFEFKTSYDLPLRQRLTLIFAYQLMPNDGLNWIFSDEKVLATWLALLEEDNVSAEALGAILDRADSIAIAKEMHNLHVQTNIIPRERRGRLGGFVDQVPESLINREQAIGLEFIHWIHDGIKAEKWQMNQKPLYLVHGGVFIDDEAFKAFSHDHATHKNWHTVQQAVIALGIHRTQQINPVAEYEHGHGLIIKNSIVLPESFTLNTGEGRNVVTPIGLALNEYRKRLSIHGTWDTPGITAPSPLLQRTNKAPYG